MSSYTAISYCGTPLASRSTTIVKYTQTTAPFLRM